MKKILIILFLLNCDLYSQTNPVPYDLSGGNYSFTKWYASNPAGTYPESMIFHQTTVRDPLIDDAMEMDWTLPYDLTSKARINGLGENGISFLNTSSTQDDENSGYLGAAVLSLNTKGRENIKVKWSSGTNSPAERVYSITLQYRIGDQDAFNTLPSSYEMNNSAERVELAEISLPDEAENKDIVQLRWKYHYTGDQTGQRAELVLDDISVSSDIRTAVQSFNKIGFNKVEIANNTLNIEATIDNSYFSAELLIINLLGNTLINRNLNINNSVLIYESFDISSLPQGQYFIAIKGKKGYIIDKFIILK